MYQKHTCTHFSEKKKNTTNKPSPYQYCHQLLPSIKLHRLSKLSRIVALSMPMAQAPTHCICAPPVVGASSLMGTPRHWHWKYRPLGRTQTNGITMVDQSPATARRWPFAYDPSSPYPGRWECGAGRSAPPPTPPRWRPGSAASGPASSSSAGTCLRGNIYAYRYELIDTSYELVVS